MDIQALIDDTLSDAAQARMFSELVAEITSEIKQLDERILQHPVEVTRLVDGVAGTITSIHQTVTLEFAISEDILGFIANLLAMHSPVGSGVDKHPGQYKFSNKLYGDGILVSDISRPPQAKEFIFINTLPYAGKIASGESSQAPNGVYEVVANESQKRFPSSKIDYVDHVDGFGKYPAIRVRI